MLRFRADTMDVEPIDVAPRYKELLQYKRRNEYNNIVARFHNYEYTIGPPEPIGDYFVPDGSKFNLIAFQGIPIANEATFAMSVVPNPRYKPLGAITIEGQEIAKQGPLAAPYIIQRKLTCRKKVGGYVLVETILPRPVTAHEINVDVTDQVLIEGDKSLSEIQNNIIGFVTNCFNYKSDIKKLPHGRFDFDESGPIWDQRFKDFFSIRIYIERHRKSKRLVTEMSCNKRPNEPPNGEKTVKKKVITSPFTARNFKRYKLAVGKYIEEEVEIFGALPVEEYSD